MTTHAQLLIAKSILDSELVEELKTESLDTVHFIRDRFSIDDSRQLIAQSSGRGWDGKRNFIIFTQNINTEAQNSLLKLLEEPPAGAVYYLVIPNISFLLPTLKSRLVLVSNKSDREIGELASSFIKMSIAERLDLIADLAKKSPESLSEIIIDVSKSDIKNEELKKSLLTAVKYINNKGASKKMLAEEVALSLP